MALFTFALLTIFTASLVSSGPVAIDNATLQSNGQQALVLNCQFQSLQVNDTCNNGDTACMQNATATCVNGTWQTSPCPSSKSCFALPQVRTNGTFVACTSPNNAASIIAATGVQLNISNNCTSLGNTSFPFSTSNNTNNTIPGDCGNSTQGANGTSSDPGQVVPSNTPTTTQPSLTLPPTTTTLSPEQASSLFSSAGVSAPRNASGSVNLGGNAGGAPPVILLTSAPISSPTPTPPSAGIPSNGGYSN